MNEVVMVSGVRTAVGDFLGSLKDMNCVELGVIVLKAAMERAKVDPALIEEVVCGNPDSEEEAEGTNRIRDDRLPSMRAVPGRPSPAPSTSSASLPCAPRRSCTRRSSSGR